MRRGQNEDHVRWWLFQSFQQSIEGCRAKLVHLVDDVNLEASRDRRKMHLVNNKIANLLNLSVRGRVDLKHIETGTLGDLAAQGALVTGIVTWATLTIKGLGKNSG